jgi:uridylate kinase
MLKGMGIDRVTADQMGMLATVMNGLALRAAVEHQGGVASVFSAVPMQVGVELFDRRLCLERMDQGHLAVLVGGTGHPFFTTDTAAALRASEIQADYFFKATKVDGVYEDDPEKNPGAQRFDTLSYMEFLNKQLKVMDATAVTLCMENQISIVVFNLMVEGSLGRVLDGEPLGTVIS